MSIICCPRCRVEQGDVDLVLLEQRQALADALVDLVVLQPLDRGEARIEVLLVAAVEQRRDVQERHAVGLRDVRHADDDVVGPQIAPRRRRLHLLGVVDARVFVNHRAVVRRVRRHAALVDLAARSLNFACWSGAQTSASAPRMAIGLSQVHTSNARNARAPRAASAGS
jgi:hypothetical protein